ncbi:MAG TPA: hypothetical protein CFH81_08820 [Sulfurovum sp. UBA12169]|nr:MAG TPA: hypothetical protein CFH81_08820 [Sulfurovum sp. UBA12169]
MSTCDKENGFAAKLNSVYGWLTELMPSLSALLGIVDSKDEIIAAADEATEASSEAQLRVWEAQAKMLTADSYANELSGVLVKIYSSNGDGTFSSVDSDEYSALHWAGVLETLGTGGTVLELDLAPKLGGALDCNLKTINKSAVRQIIDASVSAGTHTFDYANGDMQQLTVTGNMAIAFSGFPAGQVSAFIIDAVNWGSYTVTHPVGMLFGNGEAPIYTSAGTDRLLVTCDKDGIFTLSVTEQNIKAVVA